MKVIFDFVIEKYEANSKGLMPFRAPTVDELAIITTLPPPGPVDPLTHTSVNPPPPIEYFDDGLNDITRINEDWETFMNNHASITCEKISETTFKVYISFQSMLMADIILQTSSVLQLDNRTRSPPIKTNFLYPLHIITDNT